MSFAEAAYEVARATLVVGTLAAFARVAYVAVRDARTDPPTSPSQPEPKNNVVPFAPTALRAPK